MAEQQRHWRSPRRLRPQGRADAARARRENREPRGNRSSRLREEMDRLFDNFWRGFGMGRPARRIAEPQPLGRFMTSLGMAIPDIDIVEAEKEYRIVASFPAWARAMSSCPSPATCS